MMHEHGNCRARADLACSLLYLLPSLDLTLKNKLRSVHVRSKWLRTLGSYKARTDHGMRVSDPEMRKA